MHSVNIGRLATNGLSAPLAIRKIHASTLDPRQLPFTGRLPRIIQNRFRIKASDDSLGKIGTFQIYVRDVGVAGSNPVTPTIDLRVHSGSTAVTHLLDGELRDASRIHQNTRRLFSRYSRLMFQLRRGTCDSALPRHLDSGQRFAAIRRSYECQLRPRREFRVVIPCRVRGRPSASKCQIEPLICSGKIALYESGVAPNAALPNTLENTVCENLSLRGRKQLG